jgi:methyl-accepting chemotaxis protein
MDMQHLDTVLIVMVVVYGASVLLHISVLAGLWLGVNKALQQTKLYAEQMEMKVLPVLASTREVLEQTKALVTRLEPKLDAAATDLSDITRMAREETARISAAADEITQRFRNQAERVAQMTENAVDGVERASTLINNAVAGPVRQASGFIAAARAIISTLRQPHPHPHHPSHPTDEDYQQERQQYV